MLFDLDLHMHSRYSYDGIMAPDHMVHIAKRRGLAGIAVTDHETIRGGVEAHASNDDPKFLVIIGCEVHTEVGDILGLFLKDEIRSRHSREVVAEITKQGGLAVLPHPYSHHQNLTPDLLQSLTCVEVFNGRDKQDFAAQIDATYVQPYGLTAMGNSDAHLYWEIGRARTRVDLPQLTASQVREALTAGDCSPVRMQASRSQTAVYTSKILKRIRRLKAKYNG